MKPIKRLPRDEFKNYVYREPLEVPDDYDPDAAFRTGVETGEWGLYETAARRVCRLIIESAGRNRSVRRWLLATRRMGDREWNRLIVAIGRETPDIAREINALGPSAVMLGWAVASAAYLLEGEQMEDGGSR